MQMRLPGGRPKALTLSYDDGQVHDIRLIKTLDEYGIKATFNVNTGNFTPEDRVREKFDGVMKLSEAKELYTNSGHEVAVHTLTHPWLASLSPQEMLYEVLEDRKNIEREFGCITRGMAYPFGCFNDETVEALKAAGIVYSRTTVATKSFDFPRDWLRLPATCHHSEPQLMELAKTFVEGGCYASKPKLFYLWGHSYEFHRNDNWEIIEDFARYIGGRDDIWYATNIEIYDYCEAYSRLTVSYDKHIVTNPSAQTVWFEEKGQIYEVAAGETVNI